jgi:carboxyl-terminal processing protease
MNRLNILTKCILCVCITALSANSAKAQNMTKLNAAMDKLAAVLQIVDNNYMDSTNTDKLVEDAIEGLLAKLDPHSVYTTPKEMKEFNEPLNGNFEGVGIQFNLLKDTITVISPISGGPSEKVGILAGDRIVKINDTTVAGIKIKNEGVMKKLRGTKGTKVKVGILRRGVSEILDFTITRDKIPLYSIDATYMAAPEIGYIKLNRFAQTSYQEFIESLTKLKAEGAKDLILDLQDNGGGFLNIAFELADEFLSTGKLIVYTKGIHSAKRDYNSTSKGNFEKGRLIVLVDEGSASASEILSGAVQDWDRGLVIGRRTFGKGLVQNQFPLPDGSGMRLTTAQYFTPTGRCIQKPYDGTESYYKDLYNRYKHGELQNVDSIKFPDSLKYKTPNGKLVYGGGGIMPDIFIPLDTTMNSKYFTDLARKGIMNQFTLTFVDKNRSELKSKYPSFEDFKKNFIVDDKIMKQFVEAGEKDGVKEDKEGLKTSDKAFRIQIKAFIARDLFKNDNFYEVFNELNDPLRKAIEVLKDDKAFKKFKINNAN